MGKFNAGLSKIGKSVKELPKAKKVYASLWLGTGVVLATLIGLFVGLSSSSTQRDDSKGVWAIAENKHDQELLTFDDKNNNNVIDQNEQVLYKGLEVKGWWDASTVGGTPTFKAIDKADYDKINTAAINTKWTSFSNQYEKVNVTYEENGATLKKPLSETIHVKDAPTIYKVESPDLRVKVADPKNPDALIDNKDVDTSFKYIKYVDQKDKDQKEQYAALDAYFTYDYKDVKSGKGYTPGPLTKTATSQQNAIASIGALFAVSTAASIFTTAGVEMVSRKRRKAGK